MLQSLPQLEEMDEAHVVGMTVSPHTMQRNTLMRATPLLCGLSFVTVQIYLVCVVVAVLLVISVASTDVATRFLAITIGAVQAQSRWMHLQHQPRRSLVAASPAQCVPWLAAELLLVQCRLARCRHPGVVSNSRATLVCRPLVHGDFHGRSAVWRAVVWLPQRRSQIPSAHAEDVGSVKSRCTLNVAQRCHSHRWRPVREHKLVSCERSLGGRDAAVTCP